MTYTIRQATPDDLEEIVILLDTGFFPLEREFLITDLRQRFSDRTCTSFVAIDEETIVGHAGIRQGTPDKAYFGFLAVHEAQRNRGIATALSQTRVAYLQRNNFQGIAQADAVTRHPYSQQQLSSVGFSPVRILLGRLPDHGNGPETSVSFLRLFSPAGLWKSDVATLPLYLPQEYRDVAAKILQPFGSPYFKETTTNKPGERTRSFVFSEHGLNSGRPWTVQLYEPSAPAEIALLRKKGYIVAGFAPVIKEGNISAAAQMYRVPDIALDKDKIKIIPAVQPLFDFVWGQYAKVKT